MRGALLLAVPLVAAAVLLVHGPIPQDPGYHRFADTRGLPGVPNTLNVLSNAPFALVGALGLASVLRGRGTGFADPRERWAYAAFFLGVAATGAGSAWYHLAPDNARLVWDRLPMTLAFVSLLAAAVAERVDVPLGRRLLGPLLVLGLASVLHWHLTEQRGAGDLRLYALVQFVPLLVVPLLMALYEARYTRGGDMVVVVALYGAAKLFEAQDAAVFRLGHILSGHSLKHLAAAAATYWVLRMLRRRVPSPA